MNDYSPLDELERLLKYWWLVTLLMVLGGVVGWLMSLAATPMYEARASLVIQLYSGETDKLNDAQSSMELSSIAALVSPKALGPDLVEEFAEACAGITIADLQVERREAVWDLVARCQDPVAAAELANAWAGTALIVLEEAYQHGLNVQTLASMVDALESCGADPGRGICAGYTEPALLEQKLQALWDEIGEEKRASQGVNPNLVFSIESLAQVPEKPVTNGRGVLILAGAVIGLLAGTLAVVLWKRISAGKGQ